MSYPLAPTRSVFSKEDRCFLQAVAQVAFSNPFDRTRIEAEKLALGDAFVDTGPVWCRRGSTIVPNENIRRIAARLRPILERTRERLAAGAALSEEDRLLYVEACLYFLFDSHDAAFQPLIDERAGEEIVPGLYRAFLADYDRFLVFRGPGLHPPRPEHVFACIFQIRRAFHHIFTCVLGTSAPAAALRAAIWRAIFTHNLRRYVRSCDRRRLDVSTLVLGETGTGKELVARAIGLSTYVAFDPKAERFVTAPDACFRAVQLSALAESLFESELFGHERGAFTGAVKDRKGLFSGCEAGGVVFLDEIGELAMSRQATLLRVLEVRRFHRVGDNEEQVFTARVVAATHRNLAEWIRADAFRLDLYERLAGLQIHTPTLREQLAAEPGERRQLVAFIAGQVAEPDEEEALTDEVEGFIEGGDLRRYPWPGNVRELRRCVESVYMEKSFVPLGLGDGKAVGAEEEDPVRSIRALAMSEQQVLRRYASMVHEMTGEVLKETARVLGVTRKTVAARLDHEWLAQRARRRGR
jgi:transcriptional regulator with AAA-type ATPase domain